MDVLGGGFEDDFEGWEVFSGIDVVDGGFVVVVDIVVLGEVEGLAVVAEKISWSQNMHFKKNSWNQNIFFKKIVKSKYYLLLL